MKSIPDMIREESPETGGALSLWVTERLCGLMAAHDVPARQQASLLGELCGLSLSQARRKLRGAIWSFNEVFAIVNHFGASMNEVFSVLPTADEQIDLSSDVQGRSRQPASFLMGRGAMPCRVRIGARVAGPATDSELLTAEGAAGWYVGTHKQLAGQGVEPPYFLAVQVLLTPAPTRSPIRIAILDDDPGTAETLAEWFNASGYEAQAFTSSESLQSSGIAGCGAFIVDLMLAGGVSSQAILKTIRQTLPAAPILLLTGKLRSGEVSEAQLTILLRTLNVTFFEKPVRPSVLAATIEKELDLLAKGR